MIRQTLNSIRKKYEAWLRSALVFSKHADAKVDISKSGTLISGKISVGKNSSLEIADGVVFSGQLTIGENCKVSIGKNCSFTNVFFNVSAGSSLIIADHCVFTSAGFSTCSVILENGKLKLQEHAHIQAEILVRFGGECEIGARTSINGGSELRCEEKLAIGAFCLISYDVCIYDTNAHSTDAQERREAILRDAVELIKPVTKPISIGDDVWIGKGATIIKGVTLGSRSIVGIRTTVPSGTYGEDSRIVSAKPVQLNK